MAKKHVFLSYCHDNQAEVARLRNDLIAAGETVWWDEDILAGQHLKDAILAALDESYAVVVCWSQELESRGKSGVYPEISDAIEALREFPPGSIYLIVARLSECTIPLIRIDATRTLRGLKYVDLFPEPKRPGALSELVTALRATAGHP